MLSMYLSTSSLIPGAGYILTTMCINIRSWSYSGCWLHTYYKVYQHLVLVLSRMLATYLLQGVSTSGLGIIPDAGYIHTVLVLTITR